MRPPQIFSHETQSADQRPPQADLCRRRCRAVRYAGRLSQGEEEATEADLGAAVLARLTEVESGNRADRPELAKALHLA